MESRIAIIGIIVEDIDASSKVNDILHDYGMYILGRMGIPYHEKGVNIISIAIDAPQDIINTLAGKLGKVEGISAKTIESVCHRSIPYSLHALFEGLRMESMLWIICRSVFPIQSREKGNMPIRRLGITMTSHTIMYSFRLSMS